MDVLAAQNTPLSFPANKAHCKCELFEILERQRRLPAVQSSLLTHRNPFHLPPRPFFLSRRRSPPRHRLSPTRPKSASSPNLPFPLLSLSLSFSIFSQDRRSTFLGRQVRREKVSDRMSKHPGDSISIITRQRLSLCPLLTIWRASCSMNSVTILFQQPRPRRQPSPMALP